MRMDDEDIHSLLNDFALSDERLQNEGFVAGLKTGKLTGYCEGYSLGQRHGTELALEIGFIKGFISVWPSLMTKGTCPTNNRKSKAIHKLAKLLDELKFESISDEQLQAIRDQFKVVKALLNLGASRPEQQTF
ncbi:hypothetical protein LSAT2_016526 [Lamellibrachia satsuma]|nr:hypothetical protein LSAT2_016526 [Lamellibrachia satsuma]